MLFARCTKLGRPDFSAAVRPLCSDLVQLGQHVLSHVSGIYSRGAPSGFVCPHHTSIISQPKLRATCVSLHVGSNDHHQEARYQVLWLVCFFTALVLGLIAASQVVRIKSLLRFSSDGYAAQTKAHKGHILHALGPFQIWQPSFEILYEGIFMNPCSPRTMKAAWNGVPHR